MLLVVAFAVQGVHDAVERNLQAPATTPMRIDELVARDGGNPRRDGCAAYPGIALQMQREQDFLHDIFRVEPHGLRTRADRAPQRGCQQRQQAMVGRAVARERLLHEHRPMPFVVFGIHGLLAIRR